MSLTKLSGLLSLLLLVACIEAEPMKKVKGNSDEKKYVVGEAGKNYGVAAKNFAQINNTYARLTGVSAGDVSDEFDAVQMQLPSSSNPNSLNGFNQISSVRLAFAYCDEYVDDNGNGRRDQFDSMTDNQVVTFLMDSFGDFNPEQNSDHRIVRDELRAIMADEDDLINTGSSVSNTERRRFIKLSCAALLASSHVTLL